VVVNTAVVLWAPECTARPLARDGPGAFSRPA